MRARIGIILLTVAGAGAAVVLGPRPRVEKPRRTHFDLPELKELDGWIREREARLQPTPGTEARIRWASTASTATDVALVYLHGFSASRQETAPLPESMADALNANLYEARFTGHGLRGAALGEAQASDWIRDAQEAAAVGRRLGRKVVVLACSTGATVAAYLSAYRAWDVDAQVWMSPNFGPRDPSAQLLTWPWAETWVPWVAGSERSWEPENEAQGRYWTTSYPVSALFPMQALVDGARQAPLDAIRDPILLVYSKEDDVVNPDAIEKAFGRLGSPRRRKLVVSGPGDPHVLAGEILSPARTSTIRAAAVDFVRDVL